MFTSFVFLQITNMFGFIIAITNIAVVPNNANIVDITLVSRQVTFLFGFILAPSNIAVVPNHVNIVDITLVCLQVTTLFGFKITTIKIAMEPRNVHDKKENNEFNDVAKTHSFPFFKQLLYGLSAAPCARRSSNQ